MTNSTYFIKLHFLLLLVWEDQMREKDYQLRQLYLFMSESANCHQNGEHLLCASRLHHRVEFQGSASGWRHYRGTSRVPCVRCYSGINHSKQQIHHWIPSGSKQIIFWEWRGKNEPRIHCSSWSIVTSVQSIASRWRHPIKTYFVDFYKSPGLN